MPRSLLGSTPWRFATAMYIASKTAAGALIVMLVETLSSGNFLEKGFHILQRGNRDADLANFSHCDRVIGVIADLGGQVKGNREAGLALIEQVAVALVGLLQPWRSRHTGAWSTGGCGTSPAGCPG